jgi:bifunctional oligoribonuclease and PAP phosphatase NrnA
MSSQIDSQIKAAFSEADRIVLTSHIRPDQDAIGSLLGLGAALESAGKQVQMVLTDSISVSMRFLEGAAKVKHQAESPFDLFVSLDCSDTKRLGDALPEGVTVDVNIDHHLSNLNFGRLNLVEPETVATSAVIATHLADWGLKMDQSVAEALLMGILGDSLGFRTSNTTASTLRLAADLMDYGINLPEIYNKTLVGRSFQAAKYWGVGLEKLTKSHGIIYSSLSLKDRKSVSYPGNDDADLINMLSTIEGASVAVMFVEQGREKVKVSWRAIPGLDISKLALSFGGGGHPAASGAEIKGTLADVQEMILSATINYVKNSDNKNTGNIG